jgi:hypothetical protein
MLNRLKRALVDSYIGAIALGYLLAQVFLYFISIFSAPVTGWIAEKRTAELMNRPPISTPLLLQNALPQLMNFVVLLIVWYILLRWLYFEKPLEKTASPASVPN